MRKLAWAAFGLAGTALAQSDIPTDVSSWFTDAAALAAVVAFVVSLLRKHLLRQVDGPAVVALSAAVGVVLAYAGQRLGYALPQHPVVYGVTAGLLASGGVDFLKKVLPQGGQKAEGGQGTGGGGDSAPPAGDARTDAGRARLR